MKLQEELVKRIDAYIEKLKREQDLTDLKFRVYRATTNTIYVRIVTFANETRIRKCFRLSDHHVPYQTSKIVSKNTNFSFIERKIKKLIKIVRVKRFEEIARQLERKYES